MEEISTTKMIKTNGKNRKRKKHAGKRNPPQLGRHPKLCHHSSNRSVQAVCTSSDFSPNFHFHRRRLDSARAPTTFAFTISRRIRAHTSLSVSFTFSRQQQTRNSNGILVWTTGNTRRYTCTRNIQYVCLKKY